LRFPPGPYTLTLYTLTRATTARPTVLCCVDQRIVAVGRCGKGDTDKQTEHGATRAAAAARGGRSRPGRLDCRSGAGGDDLKCGVLFYITYDASYDIKPSADTLMWSIRPRSF